MKIAYLTDLHGKSLWEEVAPEKYDKIIFGGDYVDAFGLTNEEILTNLLGIIYFKQKYPDKIELLVGNHDIQYILYGHALGRKVLCSGFRSNMVNTLHEIFSFYKSIFKAAYQIDNILFTHAGISLEAWNSHLKSALCNVELTGDIAHEINIAYKQRKEELFYIGESRGGMHKRGSIFWADRRETEFDLLPGIIQIVGHTHVDNRITAIDDKKGEIYYCDTGTIHELEYKDGELIWLN